MRKNLIGLVALIASILFVGSANAQDNPAPQGGQASALLDVVCGSAASSCVLKTGPGNLYGFYANCTAACWVMVFNSATLPSNGGTTAGKGAGGLVECIAILTVNDQRGKDYDPYPIFFNTGITVAISSTACATLTAATTGFIHVYGK